jgi:hypothetical protein
VFCHRNPLALAAQAHQPYRFVDAGADHDRPGVGVDYAAMTETHERLHDFRNAPSLFHDLPAGDARLFVTGLGLEVLCQAGDAGDRVADFVGNA